MKSATRTRDSLADPDQSPHGGVSSLFGVKSVMIALPMPGSDPIPTPPVLHADERIVVCDKPTSLLSVPGIGPEKADCLVSRLQDAFPGVRIVHRLDRDTSGVIVLARDAEAHRDLSIQFQDRLVQKRYVALAGGVMRRDRGTIDLPLRKDLVDTPRQVVDFVHGRPSVTHFEVIAREADRTRVALQPVTGRSHQLRLHLRAIGHPIIGDDLYAPPALRDAADRLLLHAEWLRFAHPSTGSIVEYVAPRPF